jgi:hypothetical protein
MSEPRISVNDNYTQLYTQQLRSESQSQFSHVVLARAIAGSRSLRIDFAFHFAKCSVAGCLFGLGSSSSLKSNESENEKAIDSDRRRRFAVFCC